ncbi:MAG: universal stress protein [Desulfobaccales bacterium]
MLPFKRILCPTDFSEPAFIALKRGEELARHFEADLIVAHVIPPLPVPHSFPDPEADFNFDVPLFQQELALKAEQMLKELVSHHKVGTRTVVATGEAATEILRIAHQEHVDLIVIASHGLAGWQRLVFGSVSEKVVRQSTCPVLTIVAPAEAENPAT